ncbi:MAG: alpha/beta hydrolase [Lachnotalea sp.]
MQIHGGGLTIGDKTNDTAYCDYMEEAGFTIVNVNYTLIPNGKVIDVVQDLTATLHWVTDHADEYNLDVENVILNGESAGGYCVGLLAAVFSSDELQDYYGVTIPDMTIKAYGMICPMTELDSLADQTEVKNDDGVSVADIVNDTKVLQMGRLTDIIDPATYPEVYLLTTKGDTVWYPGVANLHEYMTGVGIEHQYVVCESDKKVLIHVFNVTLLNWEESKKANQDMITYFKSKLN